MAKLTEPGYVYVLSNPAFKFVKIGHTKQHPQVRCNQLSRMQGVPLPFKVEWAGYVKNCYPVEQAIHMLFGDKCVGKEFFDVDIETVKSVLKKRFKALSKAEHMLSLFERGCNV